MRQLLFLVAVLLVACSKPEILTKTETLYYRLQEVNEDGSVYTSAIQHVKVNNTEVARDGDDDEDEDDDEDDDNDNDDDDHCDTTVLPIKMETFIVTKINNNHIRVSWEAENEEGVSHYIIQRSTDLKTWVGRLNYIPDLSGKYTIIDTYDVK